LKLTHILFIFKITSWECWKKKNYFNLLIFVVQQFKPWCKEYHANLASKNITPI